MVSPASVGPPAQMFFICDEADEDIAQECVHPVRAETPAQAVSYLCSPFLFKAQSVGFPLTVESQFLKKTIK